MHRSGERRKDRRDQGAPLHVRRRDQERFAQAGRKVKGTIHWVSAEHAVPAEVRLYDYLFCKPDPNDVPEGMSLQPEPQLAGGPHRLQLEPGLAALSPATATSSSATATSAPTPDSRPGKPIFNRTVTLHDTWAKIEKAEGSK